MTTQPDYTEGVRQQVRRLHELRLAHKNTVELLAEANKKWHEEHQELLDDEAKLGQDVKALEDRIQDYALAGHRVTGETKYPGVAIKEFTVLDYTEAEALAWAREMAPHLLTTPQLKKQHFEAVAKVTPLSFVTITKDPRAQIASDLAKVLEKQE